MLKLSCEGTAFTSYLWHFLTINPPFTTVVPAKRKQTDNPDNSSAFDQVVYGPSSPPILCRLYIFFLTSTNAFFLTHPHSYHQLGGGHLNRRQKGRKTVRRWRRVKKRIANRIFFFFLTSNADENHYIFSLFLTGNRLLLFSYVFFSSVNDIPGLN